MGVKIIVSVNILSWLRKKKFLKKHEIGMYFSLWSSKIQTNTINLLRHYKLGFSFFNFTFKKK